MSQSRKRLPARAALLPEDVLADILARLAPRGLAVARAVCRAWRATVDEHRLLRADLLPLLMAGIFVNFRGHRFPEYFSRPSSSTGGAPGSVVSGHMHYLPPATSYLRTRIRGQCNGLLLLDLVHIGDHVVNPATWAWAPVPPPPALNDGLPSGIFSYRSYLVFDPTLSPYYEVVSFPHVNFHRRSPRPPAVARAEWPPSRCTIRVFSSRTNRWEERSFIREGEAQSTVLDMYLAGLEEHYSTYSRGALYALCQATFVIRISMSHKKYQAIKPPVSFDDGTELYLGKSEKGVYLASYNNRLGQLRVWMLDESCGRMEWLLKHNCGLLYVLRGQRCCQQASGPWVLQDVNYNFYRDGFPDSIQKAPMEERDGWDSNNDDVLVGNGDGGERHHCGVFTILGFHPFKEVIFFSQSEEMGLAYHWNTFKVQDLGDMYPTEYNYFAEMYPSIHVAFPYTPCWM